MTSEERGVRLDQFMVGVKWMMALLAVMAVLSFVLTVGSISDTRRQALEAISDLRKQIDVIKDQNHWSLEDRAALHQTQGELREALKRLGVTGEPK